MSEKIFQRGIEEEMRTAYIDYSMSVIVSRALPDVRDGLKPVHRRILYAMSELGLASNRPYKKSARIVGEVLGKYHPHGDSAVYDTMVRMAQHWSLRYMLVDGQGNYGSVDNDPPAAMRYTEARMRAFSEELLSDLDKNTVDFQPNFDDSLSEPVVLPAGIPNLLVNGASGIAVGMATNMAPHNLSECVAGIKAYINNRDITVEELMEYVKAPDFPTGGIIYGVEGVKDAFRTGRGKIVMRAKAHIESTAKRERIIINEIPYQVVKSTLVEKIAFLMNEKKIEGISGVRDESDRDGMRIVVDLKKDAVGKVVLNNLYKHTTMQVAFNVNNVALVKGRPRQLNLRDLIHHYVEHRHEVVIRRTQYELEQAEARAHILEGLIIALDNLDAVIKLIRESKTPDEARTGLMSSFELSELQAKAILDMRLQRLTNLETVKIREEYQELLKKIADYKEILASEPRRMQIIQDELDEADRKFGDERRSQVVLSAEEFSVEDMIANEDVVITISHAGYIKRTPLRGYRQQKRGGVGAKGAGTREEDFLDKLFIASTHNYLLFFTSKGRCYWLKVYEIPEGTRSTKGRAIQNLIQLEPDDRVLTTLNVPKLDNPDYMHQHAIVMITRQGTIKKTLLEEYSRPRATGIIAIKINEGDELLGADLVGEQDEIVMATRQGNAIRFGSNVVRAMGRNAAGVRGVMLQGKGDEVVGMVTIRATETQSAQLLVLAEKGYGKRSLITEYRITNRGGKGIRTMNLSPKTGELVAIKQVTDEYDLMIITRNGLTIRTPVRDIRTTGRAAMGVKVINLREDDAIADVTTVPTGGEEDQLPPEADGTAPEGGDAPTLPLDGGSEA